MGKSQHNAKLGLGFQDQNSTDKNSNLQGRQGARATTGRSKDTLSRVLAVNPDSSDAHPLACNGM